MKYCDATKEKSIGCPYLDNGYCHWSDFQEIRKRKLLYLANGITRPIIKAICLLSRKDLIKT